jgi:hypothetical protein
MHASPEPEAVAIHSVDASGFGPLEDVQKWHRGTSRMEIGPSWQMAFLAIPCYLTGELAASGMTFTLPQPALQKV